MSRPSFSSGIALAAVLALIAGVLVSALVPVIEVAAGLDVAVPALALVYLLYLFSQSRSKVGRVTLLVLWSGLTALCWWLELPVSFDFVAQATYVWFARALYFYSEPLPASIDLCLSAMSMAATMWAISQSGSVFLATWCFFLLQATFVAIPPTFEEVTLPGRTKKTMDGQFDDAKHRARQALQKLTVYRN